MGGRGAGSSISKGVGTKLNSMYASFLKNGNAKEAKPQNIKAGDSIITNPVDKRETGYAQSGSLNSAAGIPFMVVMLLLQMLKRHQSRQK